MDFHKAKGDDSGPRANQDDISRQEWPVPKATTEPSCGSSNPGTLNLGRRAVGQTQKANHTCFPRWEVDGNVNQKYFFSFQKQQKYFKIAKTIVNQ